MCDFTYLLVIFEKTITTKVKKTVNILFMIYLDVF